MIFSAKDGKIKFLYLQFTAKIVPRPVWGKRQFISWPLILSHDSRGHQNTIVFWNRSSSSLMVCGKLIHCTLSCTKMVMRITSLLSIDDMHTWLGSYILLQPHTRLIQSNVPVQLCSLCSESKQTTCVMSSFCGWCFLHEQWSDHDSSSPFVPKTDN